MVNDYSRPAVRVGDGRQPTFHARPLWTGGVATAMVAALIGLVGVVGVRGLFRIPVFGASRYGTFGDASTLWLCVFAAAGALLATGLMHVLLLSTPRPTTFFGWIVVLTTTAAALQPFTTAASLQTRVATGLINAVIGLAIVTLVSGVAASARARGVLRRGEELS